MMKAERKATAAMASPSCYSVQSRIFYTFSDRADITFWMPVKEKYICMRMPGDGSIGVYDDIHISGPRLISELDFKERHDMASRFHYIVRALEPFASRKNWPDISWIGLAPEIRDFLSDLYDIILEEDTVAGLYFKLASRKDLVKKDLTLTWQA